MQSLSHLGGGRWWGTSGAQRKIKLGPGDLGVTPSTTNLPFSCWLFAASVVGFFFNLSDCPAHPVPFFFPPVSLVMVLTRHPSPPSITCFPTRGWAETGTNCQISFHCWCSRSQLMRAKQHPPIPPWAAQCLPSDGRTFPSAELLFSDQPPSSATAQGSCELFRTTR